MRSFVVLLVGSCLLIASCGDDPRKASPDDLAAALANQEVELTDALMEEYVRLLREWKERTRAGDHGFAWLGDHGWSVERWAYIQQGVSQALALQTQRGLASTATHFDERIAELESRLAGADGAQQDVVRQQLEAMRKAKAGMGEASASFRAFDTPVGRKNLAVLERWLERIQEASR